MKKHDDRVTMDASKHMFANTCVLAIRYLLCNVLGDKRT